ncbi:ComEC/Rec2 family competence protein [Planctomycetota bacterium]|nr:ComEC/Rec2 family competence protein [Planctomycetota bacterium]
MSIYDEFPYEPETPKPKPRFLTPVVCVALSIILGIIFSQPITSLFTWLLLCIAATVATTYQYLNNMYRSTGYVMLSVIICIAAIWSLLYSNHLPSNHTTQYISPQSQLATLQGRIVSQPRVTQPAKGAFKQFTYKQPGTSFLLQINHILVNQKQQPTSGKVLVRIAQSDPRLVFGAEISIIGWLRSFQPPSNPGEFNYKEALENRDIAGTLNVESRGNWELIANNPTLSVDLWQKWRNSAAQASMRGLESGFDKNDQNILGILKPLLLGDWRDTDPHLTEQFRRVGLSHILSISGAHLAILLGFAWLIGLFLFKHPKHVAIFILIILACYLFILPLRVPIVRAAIMATCFCFAQITGRPIRAINAWAIAVIFSLAYNPSDLFSPGFQLSFAIVATLLIFTTKLSNRIYLPNHAVGSTKSKLAQIIIKRTADYLAVSIIAFTTALPIVAWHFELISPVAILLSIIAIPFLTILLAIGFLKIVFFYIFPSISICLAILLKLIVMFLEDIILWTHDLPVSHIQLSHKPSIIWVAITSLSILLFMTGKLKIKSIPAVIVIITLGCWLIIGPSTATILGKTSAKTDNNLHLYMFAVSNGSCYLLKHQNQVIMFDCGSQAYLDVADKSIIPAIRQLDIKKIDAMVVSHSDLDHFSGVIDLAQQINISKIYAPPQLIQKAKHEQTLNLNRSTKYLVEELNSIGHVIQPLSLDNPMHMTRQTESFNYAILWPPINYHPKADNDTSIVLRIDFAGRSLLLSGDIQSEAIQMLQASTQNLDVDITDLPHHGSFITESPQFIQMTSPQIVLQSAGYKALQQDPWLNLLQQHNIQRFITARDGMVHLQITPQGEILTSTFK